MDVEIDIFWVPINNTASANLHHLNTEIPSHESFIMLIPRLAIADTILLNVGLKIRNRRFIPKVFEPETRVLRRPRHLDTCRLP